MEFDKDYCCEDRGDVREWTQIKVTVPLQHLDELTAIMSMVNNNLMIEDYSDIDLKTCYGDLIDESILNADKTVASVSVFVSAERSYADVQYPERVFLVFGRESVGLPAQIVAENKERALRIPMLPTLRCLNLSNSVAIATYEVLRQRGFDMMV